MSMFRWVIIVFFVSLYSSCNLNEVAPNEMAANKASLDALYKKSWEVMSDYPDSALYYADRLMEVAGKINDKMGMIDAYYVKGNAYNKLYYFDLAAKEFYEALALLKGDDSETVLIQKALTLQGLGQSYDKAYNYDMAIDMYSKGLEVAEAVGYKQCIADLNYNLGICYQEKNNYEGARKYYLKALEDYETIGKYRNLANCYNMIGRLYHFDGKFNKAGEHYDEALALVEKHNISTSNVSWYVNNLGELYFVQDQYEEAEKYYAEALQIAEGFNDVEKIKLFTNNLGDVYLKQSNYSEAITWYEKSIAFGTGEERIDGEIKRAYKQLAVAYEQTGNYQEALNYTHHFMGQVALLEETKDKLMVQNAQYRMKEVEWQRQLADQKYLFDRLKGWTNKGMVVFVIFLLVFIYISKRLYLHYTVHKEMKRILMTPISVELERRKNNPDGWSDTQREEV